MRVPVWFFLKDIGIFGENPLQDHMGKGYTFSIKMANIGRVFGPLNHILLFLWGEIREAKILYRSLYLVKVKTTKVLVSRFVCLRIRTVLTWKGTVIKRHAFVWWDLNKYIVFRSIDCQQVTYDLAISDGGLT